MVCKKTKGRWYCGRESARGWLVWEKIYSDAAQRSEKIYGTLTFWVSGDVAPDEARRLT